MGKQGAFRPTIGVFMHDIDESIGYERFLGIENRSRELGVNLLYFLQGTRTEPESKNVFNKLVVSKLDGLITGLTARTSLMTAEDLESYFREFNLPTVTLTESWEGASRVLFDHYQGMSDAIRHLVTTHHYRRIFFIRGPESHPGGRERYRAYREVMEEFGLYNPGLVSPPVDWKPNRSVSFAQLIAGLTPGIDFEAVAASNDDWALEVIARLQDQGVKVPEQVAVIGFNDSVQAKSCNPPLTTVANPFYEQGRRALETLLAMIEEPHQVREVILPVNLVVRQSCGCLDPVVAHTFPRVEAARSGGGKFNPDDLTALFNDSFVQEGLAEATPATQTLVNALIHELENPLSGVFLQALKAAMLTAAHGSGERIFRWQNVITNLQLQLLPVLDALKKEKAEMLLHQARILIGSNAIWQNDNYFTQYKDKFLSATAFQTYLIRSFDIGETVNLLARHLPQLGFYSGYFVLYEDRQPYIYPQQLPQWSRLMLAYNRQGQIELGKEGRRFPAAEFLPAELLPADQAYGFVVVPLFYEEYQFGYLFLEMGPHTQISYKIVVPQLKACLRGAQLFQERKKVEESLVQQALELARSNAELQQFANIASHDLQEPLRKVLTFGERLRKSSYDLLPASGKLYLDRIENAASRMHVLVNDLLTFSRVSTKAQPFAKVDLNQVVSEVLNDIEVKILEYNAIIDCQKLMPIEADALQMRQLFQNLISNALKFHREGCPPQIKIYQSKVDSQTVEIVFEDNGIGIEAIYFERIFKVFERLHTWYEYEGTGVGLAICKKIVERHNGVIQVESTPGIGSKFIVRLPVKQVVDKTW